MSEVVKSEKLGPQTTARSPIAGCAVFITVISVLFFLVGFSAWALFRQFDEIAKFTMEKPAPAAIESTAGAEGEVAALTAKLAAFQAVLEGGETQELTLSPREMNLAIAAYDSFAELRGTFRVLGGEKDTLKIALSFPMNGKPRLAKAGERGVLASDPRYLVGTMTARPVMLRDELVIEVLAIDAPDGMKVAPEFIRSFSPYRIAERYMSDQAIGPVMKKLTSARAENGNLILRRGKGEVVANTIGKEAVDSAGGRLFKMLGFGAAVFLIFAGSVVFIGLKKARRG